MHYRRLTVYGGLDRKYLIYGNDEARFWSWVDKSGDCWLWLGTTDRDGYGRFGIGPVGSRQKVRAPRYAYELQVGPISTGLTIDHLCRVRGCVRGSHLEPVTTQVNTARGLAARAASQADWITS
jgi:hypothetical protein